MRSPEPAGSGSEASGSKALETLSPPARERLKAIAAASIDHGLANGAPLALDVADHPAELREPRASFVTLRRAGALRGCVGGLEARLPLIESVAHGAFAAAFRDPRFAPLRHEERVGLEIHVTILGPLTPIPARDERELLALIRPGVDGLVLRHGEARATFLPAVWESLPGPARFLAELFRKAGLPPDHWSPRIAFERYAAEEIC